MFTGLVEGRGRVDEIRSDGAAIFLVIGVPDEVTEGAAVGDSVALNGCCLTVVDLDGNRLSFQAGTETLSKTNLGKLIAGDSVNLERPLSADGRLGGHFVQGHVDGVGQVDAVERDGEWVTMWFRVPANLAAQMVPKGSVAVDGISLTLVNVERQRFSVTLIPHTLEVTTLGIRDIGDDVNIETDILGKYVQNFLNSERDTPS